MATASPNALNKIRGLIKTVTFFNPENGYFVAKIKVEGGAEKTVLGHAPVINVGEQLEATGAWQTSNWGPQFKAIDVELSQPTMLEGIESYLSSAIKGIGKGYAKKMLAAFGTEVFEVIENTPEKLYSVEGIGKKRATSIIAAYTEQRELREVMVFLHTSGLSASKAQRVYKEYGDKSIAKIKENPYILCKDLWGIGFSTADAVALKQGIPPDSDSRISAGLQHSLLEAEGVGSCGIPVEKLLSKTSELLNVDLLLVEQCLEYEVSARNFVKDVTDGVSCIFAPKTYAAEQFIAKKLIAHAHRKPAKVLENIDGLIFSAELDLGINLDETQREAVKVALSNNICIITGGPGTGKTTITKVLLHVFKDNGFSEIVLCAPTGKAAKRAAESTGFDAKTVHRVLEVDRTGQFKFNASNPLPSDVWALDEWTMSDVRLTSSVCYALSEDSRIIFLGDVCQLPSVGPGKVLADMIESKTLPTVRLTKIFRQAATSDIIKNAHAINAGEMPEIHWKEGSDFCFTAIRPKIKNDEASKIQCRKDIETEVLRVTRDMYKLGFDPIRDVQVLAPMRRGPLGVESLNIKLQALLNPHPDLTLSVMGAKWCTGDKVMQLRNNYDKLVFNGDIGYVTVIDVAERLVTISYDERLVTYTASELDEVSLAYAFTIHKSQGSEFPVVVMVFSWSHFPMLKRNLFYTGVTRAKKLCIVVGEPEAARVAVKTAQNDERYSQLRERLVEESLKYTDSLKVAA